MDTHRYVRPHHTNGNSFDRYSIPTESYSRHYHHYHHQVEFWTNGSITLLGVPPVVSSSKTVPTRKFTTQANAWNPNKKKLTKKQYFNPTTSSEFPKMSNNLGSMDQQEQSNKVVRNSLLAGSVAGMASTIVCHPFDVLRTKMQSAAASMTTSATSTSTATTAAATANLGLLGTIRQTLQYGGVRALYTGLSLPFAAQAVYKATIFTVNNITEQFIIEWKSQENYKLGHFHSHQLTLTDRFWCGFMGGAMNAALFVTPVEFIRNQLIAEHTQRADVVTNTSTTTTTASTNATTSSQHLLRKNGPLSIIRSTIQSHGTMGLWRGLSTTILRDSVGCGCFFVAMAYTQKEVTKLRMEPSPSLSTLMISGATAGLAFWVWALPVDTIKTWIQSGYSNDLRHAMNQLSASRTTTVHQLFQGWQVAYGRGVPSAAITVMTYSYCFQFLST